MADIEGMIREVLSDQKATSEKIDFLSANQKDIAKDVRETRDSMIRVDEWRKGHIKTHSWIHKGLYAVALLVIAAIIKTIL